VCLGTCWQCCGTLQVHVRDLQACVVCSCGEQCADVRVPAPLTPLYGCSGTICLCCVEAWWLFDLTVLDACECD
jgi:hypothetical protein